MIASFRVSLLTLALLSVAFAGEAFAATATFIPPVCDIGAPYGCYVYHDLEFDGRQSYDPDGTIVSYAWDFGDGHSAQGPVVTHRYEAIGSYLLSLVVIDNDNLSSSCHTIVPISEPCPPDNCPPVCNAAGPYVGIAGFPVQFDGSGSSSPFLCIPIVHYAWSFGDGATAVGPQPTHTYTSPGVYVVTLVITDSDGASSACTTDASITSPSAVDPTTWGRIKRRLGE